MVPRQSSSFIWKGFFIYKEKRVGDGGGYFYGEPLGQKYIINLLLSNIALKLERKFVILLIYVLTT